jgi:hypothetical protein
MRISKKILIAFTLVLLALPAWSQVRVGLRAGLTVNRLSLDRDFIDSGNRAGYTGGLVLDLNIPVVGLGIEASAMYTYRRDHLTSENHTYKRHYIDIPVYARYRLTLPRVERYVAPYVFTGPSFSILFDDDAPVTINNSRTYTSWDVGGGVDLFNRLRVTATYGIGMSKAMKVIGQDYNGEQVNGKDRYWTLSAALLF